MNLSKCFSLPCILHLNKRFGILRRFLPMANCSIIVNENTDGDDLFYLSAKLQSSLVKYENHKFNTSFANPPSIVANCMVPSFP